MMVNMSGLTGLMIDNQARLSFGRTSDVTERLSSGLRINKGADDPSGLGIASSMRATISGIETSLQNALDGLSMIRTADSHLNEINDMLMRGYELAVRAANTAVYTAEDLARMQAEVDELLEQIDARANSATYNTKKLLDGGVGKKYTYTSQADWQAGTQNPLNSLDTVSSPGDMMMEPIAWSLRPEFNNPIGDNGTYHLSLYTKAYADNGDGTVTVTCAIETERAGGAGTVNYTGFLELGSSVNGFTIDSTNAGTVCSWDNVQKRLEFNGAGQQLRGNPAAGDAVEFSFTVDKTDVAWTTQIDQPNGTTTRFYFGSTQLKSELPSFSAGGYFTDYDTTNPAEWTGAAIDTATNGGKAVLNYNAITAPGSSLTVYLEESADGAAWSRLPLVENGSEFEFNERYLRAVIIETSSGIAYGSPVMEDLEITITESSILQIGENNQDDHKLFLSAMDARTSALGVQNIDITSSTKSIKVYDTQSDWFGGLGATDHVDYVSDPGFVKLLAQIDNLNNWAPQVGGRNMYWSIDTVFQNTDGTYDVTMSLKCYGQNGGAGGPTGWIGSFYLQNGDGSRIDITTARNISIENVNRPWPITPGTSNTADVNYVEDSGNDSWDAGDTRILGANGTVSGNFSRIYFDYGTTGAQDGVQFSFTCDPEATLIADFETVQFGNLGAGNHDHVADRDCDIYFHDRQVANDVDDAGLGNSFHFERRLAEFCEDLLPAAPTGDFETKAFFFGGGETGYLQGTGVTNDIGDAITYEVYQSADGIGPWQQILTRGGGTEFNVAEGFDYVYVKAFFDGQAATEVMGPGNANYQYAQSTSPVLDELRVTKGISPITEFQLAMEEVNDMRAELGITERRLLSIIESLNSQRVNIIAARSRILDADFASDAVELTKAQILNDSTQAVKAQGDPFMLSVLDLEQESNIGKNPLL